MIGPAPSSDSAEARSPADAGIELESLGVHRGAHALTRPGHKDQPTPDSISTVVPGQVVCTPHGTCFLVETRYPLHFVHGGMLLSELLNNDSPSSHLARLAGDARLTSADYRDAIFFDLETTGLGIGAGLVAFLVGLGTFEGEEFVLRQYFLRDYSEEPALLHALCAEMQPSRWWISFNGRCFDLPVLQTRFVCGQRQMPLENAPHLDLLYPSRRLWRKRLRSCRLSALESNLLGLSRDSDVPGWLIPELYFDYLRYGAAEPLGQVFVHNALDILSLVTLAARAEWMLRDPLGHRVDSAVDLFSLGAICESWQERDLAKDVYQRALKVGLPDPLHEEALSGLAMLFKRCGQLEQAVPIWRTLREKGRPTACVELAKHWEHREHDYASAARAAREALEAPELPKLGQCSAPALQARLARLERKLGREGLPMPHIESYSFGKIIVDGRSQSADLIILPTGVRTDWWRKQGHRLHKEDLRAVVEASPSVLVIGTGNVGLMQVPQETLDYLTEHNIRTVVERTAAACRSFNELAETERAAAALHLTC